MACHSIKLLPCQTKPVLSHMPCQDSAHKQGFNNESFTVPRGLQKRAEAHDPHKQYNLHPIGKCMKTEDLFSMHVMVGVKPSIGSNAIRARMY